MLLIKSKEFAGNKKGPHSVHRIQKPWACPVENMSFYITLGQRLLHCLFLTDVWIYHEKIYHGKRSLAPFSGKPIHDLVYMMGQKKPQTIQVCLYQPATHLKKASENSVSTCRHKGVCWFFSCIHSDCTLLLCLVNYLTTTTLMSLLSDTEKPMWDPSFHTSAEITLLWAAVLHSSTDQL